MLSEYQTLKQRHIDWLLQSSVPPEAIITPDPIDLARGTRGTDGIFEASADGVEWFAIHEANDTAMWRPKTGEVATECGAAFAIGADEIQNPGATALNGWLNIYADPLEWLINGRRGIVVLRWEWAREQLRDVPKIAVAEDLLGQYRRHMAPRLPQVGVIPRNSVRRAAA